MEAAVRDTARGGPKRAEPDPDRKAQRGKHAIRICSTVGEQQSTRAEHVDGACRAEPSRAEWSRAEASGAERGRVPRNSAGDRQEVERVPPSGGVGSWWR